MGGGAGRSATSSRCRDAVIQAARRFFLLLPVFCIVGTLPLDAAPPNLGAWIVAATTDRGGLFDGCVAERQLNDLQYGFRRSDRGLDLHLRSVRWNLSKNATFPVSVAGRDIVTAAVLGRAVQSDRIELPLGTADNGARLALAVGESLEVRTAGATLRLPVDTIAPMLAALDACWNKGRKAAENPFLAVGTGYSAGDGEQNPEGLIEQPTFFDADIDGEIFRLEGLVVKPADATGPLPVALITHGTTTEANELPAMRAATMLPQARDMAHRGYMAVVVTRRGYGLSQGPARSTVSTCSRPRFLKGFEADASELEAVLDLLRDRPDVDPDRMIAIGVSGGGGAVLALAARNPPGLAGVVNISGGLNLIREDGSHCESGGDLMRAFSELGARTRTASLWVYARNDSFFAPDLVDHLHDAYRAAGADADLQMLPAIGANGHDIFATAAGRYHWLPRLDDFLRRKHLPAWDASMADAAMQAGHLDASQRSWVLRYLSAPTQKMLVSTRSGRGVRLRFGQADTESARVAALADCEATFDEPCSVLMKNFALQPRSADQTAALIGAAER